MAAFTFQTGNAAGLRRLPWYLLGALATLVVPRTDDLWVFGCGVGPGEGALPLLRLARARLPARTRLVWLATTPEELARARGLGLDAELKSSRTGFRLTLRARVLVVTHGLGDVNRYATRGGFVVQLWHGIPLKRLHLDAPVALSASSRLGRAVVRRGFHVVGRQIGLFPVAGEPVVARVASAFGLSREQIAVTGDPRDDVLQGDDPDTRRSAARELLGAASGPLPAHGPLVLYAPTWRDGGIDPAEPDEATWAEIVSWLDSVDATLVVRSHPLGHADYSAGPRRSARVRLLDSAALPDLTPALPAFDLLVTDYSSTAFDFALTGGSTVFLAADVDTYLASRGLYEPYEIFTGGRQVANWKHALALLDDLVRGDADAVTAAAAHRDQLRDEHFDHLDGRATERVFAQIRARVAGEPPPAAEPGAPGRPTVTRLRIEPDRLVVELTGAEHVALARLDGPRAQVTGELERDDGVLRARFPLLVMRWGTPGLALPSGDYRLDVGTSHRVITAAGLPDVTHELFRATALTHDGGLVVRIGAPLADDERGPANQRRLRARCLLVHRREHAVYFESFYGRSASDNPVGIDRVLARVRPDVRRYWSVGDRSVAVPPGAIPLVEYSREWWRVRAQAKVYVINDWLRWTHRRRRGQRVLQTWHGTMLKRLALDRPNTSARTRFATVRQSLRWQVMLAQNDYSARKFRTSYGFRGPIWQSGYPRNDVLADQARAAQVRALVGVPAGARVVLYAPTWRDDRTDLVDYLDLAEFADALPEQHVLLVRGHSRTLGYGPDLRGARLVDVTSYPDVAELMLVADLLVTDYSSVMFDFAATGKPMIFYTPDLAHYSDVLRGFYFDLIADAPGPVVHSRDELAAAIAHDHTEEYAARYAAWQHRFTPHDDGHAGERVVRRMIDEGWFD